MTNLEINQLLHEKVMGKCWHEWIYSDTGRLVCNKCGCTPCGWLENPSYTSSWEAYGRLLEVAMMKEWWKEFAYDLNTDDFTYADYQFKEDIVLNTLRGSTALAEFVKERGI